MSDGDAQQETANRQGQAAQAAQAAQVEHGELVAAEGQQAGEGRESVEQPAKVMRIGSMIKQLLDEVRQAPLDERSRDRLREIFDTSVKELGEALSDDLSEELARLAPPFGDTPASDAELRVAQAQLVGWLEGLFHGIQATLFAQQMAARQQLEEMQRGRLPRGEEPRGATPPGTYL
ncbi:MAG: proteasome activator [Actinomycetota bacterium]